MRKNIFIIVLVAAIFVFVGAISNSTKAADDPVEAIKNAKTPVYLHSMAGGDICIPGVSDSLVHQLPTMVCTWWHSIYPPATHCYVWHCIDWMDNGDGMLSPSDRLKIQLDGTGDWIWVHVDDETITLKLARTSPPFDIMYVEFENGHRDVGPDFVSSAIYEPVVCDTLHEIWPVYCPRYHLSSWRDNGDGYLSCCDTVDIVVVGTQDTTWWHVEDVAIDILVNSIPNPQIPTMTRWGMIILGVLIIGSAIFIMLRRKRAPVPA